MNLLTKYRPNTFDEIVGQEFAVSKVKGGISRGLRSFMISGPSGVGKTTMARCLGTHVDGQVVEVNASNANGVDFARELDRIMQTTSLSGRTRVLIMDECHALTKQAWSCLLKAVEEPASGYWAFCTTDPGRVPKAIMNRCAKVGLGPVDGDAIFDLLAKVADSENMEVTDDSLNRIVDACDGSPRDALVRLGTGEYSYSNHVEPADPFGFAKSLCTGGLPTFQDALGAAKGLSGDVDVEGLRRMIVNFATTCLLNQKGTASKSKVDDWCQIMKAFREPYVDTGRSSLVHSLIDLYTE